MPWRKQPKLLKEFRARTEREHGHGAKWSDDDLFSFMELLVEKIWAATRWLLVAAVVIFLCCAGLQWQVSSRNHRLDRIEKVAKELKVDEATIKQVLTGAVEGGKPAAAASARAIKNIERICKKLEIDCE